MIIQCTICSDLIIPSENIYVTQCGHIFHYHCLYQWIVRSKSCPQCRRRITEKCMFRIFPNTTDAAPNNEEKAATLQNKLDHATLKIKQQDVELKKITEEKSNLEARLKNSEKSLNSVRDKISATEMLMNAFTEEIDFLKHENKKIKKFKQELEIVQEKLKVLQGLQVILNSTAEEVESMLKGYQDVRTLCVFATSLKKALYDTEKKTSELRNTLQKAKQHLADEKKKNTECQGKLANMEEALVNMTRKYEELKKKLEDQKVIGAMEAPGAFVASGVYGASGASDSDDWIGARDFDDWIIKNRTKKPSSPMYSPTETVTNRTCLNTMISNIENSDSPYFNLKQSSLGWAGLQFPANNNNIDTYNNNNNFPGMKPVKNKYPKPTATMVSGSLTDQEHKYPKPTATMVSGSLTDQEHKYPKPTATMVSGSLTDEEHKYPKPTATMISGSLTDDDLDDSIFYTRARGLSEYLSKNNNNDKPSEDFNTTYIFPKSKRPDILKPKSSVLKLSAKHKLKTLKRPNPSGTQDIGQMLKKMRDS